MTIGDALIIIGCAGLFTACFNDGLLWTVIFGAGVFIGRMVEHD